MHEKICFGELLKITYFFFFAHRVGTWAEKEMRNYRRLYTAGIQCPQPILLKSNVLILQFLGVNGWPSLRLKDVNLSEKRLREAYIQAILIMVSLVGVHNT